MQKLLTSGLFDCFLLEEATIRTQNVFTIDGHINRDFYTEKDCEVPALKYGFSLWKDCRSLCFQLIRGKNTPLGFKFVFHLIPEYAEEILKKTDPDLNLEPVRAFVLTVRFQKGSVNLVTGTCYRTFSPDKEPEHLWDQWIQKFLNTSQIAYEEGD